MSGIFVSYRREDSSGWVGHLASLLQDQFGADEVFMDIHTIEPGMDFVDVLTTHLRSCNVLLAVIGPHWLTPQDRGGRHRLEDPTDYVRLEITTAFDRNIRVIPVLVGGATMPRVADLPAALGRLVRHQAHELSDTRWEYDSNQLVMTLEKVLGKPALRVSKPRERAGGGNTDHSRRFTVGNVGGDFKINNSAILSDNVEIDGTVAESINQLPASPDLNKPGLKELLTQLTEAIATSSDINDEDKAEALEQMKTLAEAGKNPNDGAMKKMARTAAKILKGTVLGLPAAAKLAEECGKLLPLIAKFFGL